VPAFQLLYQILAHAVPSDDALAHLLFVKIPTGDGAPSNALWRWQSMLRRDGAPKMVALRVATFVADFGSN
jgi:hypothetical protein